MSVTGRKYDVFISYVHRDTKALAQSIREILSRNNFTVFLDDIELITGDDLGRNIEESLNGSRYFIPLLSRFYTASKWCKLEIEHVLRLEQDYKEVSIIPIKFPEANIPLIIEDKKYFVVTNLDNNAENIVSEVHKRIAKDYKDRLFDWGCLKTTWEHYLEYPSSKNAFQVYLNLPTENHIKFNGQKNKKSTIDLIYGNLRMLENNIYAGERNAVRIAFKLLVISDGAFGEGLCVILGSLIRINPKLFLEELNNHPLKAIDIKTLIGNYGDIFVDKLKAQSLEKTRRIKALELVADEHLIQIRNECIKAFT